MAIARIRGSSIHPQIYGTVSFYQKNNGVLVVANINGLPKSNESGYFGFHIHEGESCEGSEFEKTGSHYNPTKNDHPMHAGDLPSLLSVHQNAYLAVLTNRFSIRDIIGRTVVIHSKPDDFKTQPSGNAGEKIACGVINRY